MRYRETLLECKAWPEVVPVARGDANPESLEAVSSKDTFLARPTGVDSRFRQDCGGDCAVEAGHDVDRLEILGCLLRERPRTDVSVFPVELSSRNDVSLHVV